MNRFVRLGCFLLAASALIASCSKDKVSGKLTLDSAAVFLQAGESVAVGFSQSHVSGYTVTGQPTGWDEPTIDEQTQQIIIVAPDVLEDDDETTGTITITGTVNGGSSVTASLFVGIVSQTDLSAKPANSYLVNQPETNYVIDVTHKGESSNTIAPASVGIIWQSQSSLIQYLTYDNGKASFYIGADSDNAALIKSGNALIGAYDANDNLLWSWHIWAADYDLTSDAATLTLGGSTVMNRNLGALANSNNTADSILLSYGLYYQWGRKDPFIGPSTYQSSNGSAAAMYNASSSRVYMTTAESTSEVGTDSYAITHPLTYITGVSDSNYDWRWLQDNSAWSESTKTINDPCPAGWRVAQASVFNDLEIKESLSASADDYYDVYGWTLTDGSAESLFIGGGRRIYTNGTIQNVYITSVRNEALYDQPWVGYYWTAAPNSGSAQANAFHFWFNKSDVSASGVAPIVAQHRANGMLLRCMKVN